MKSTHLLIVFAILVLGGTVIFFTNSSTSTDNVVEPLPATDQLGVPAPGNEDVEEMIVEDERDEDVDGQDDSDEHRGGGDVGMEFPTIDEGVDTTSLEKSEEKTSQTHVFNISGVNFAFNETEIRVKEGDTVTVNFTSESGLHNWSVEEFGVTTDIVSAGKSASVTFVADKVGTYEYFCSVGSHRSLGMVGTLIVE